MGVEEKLQVLLSELDNLFRVIDDLIELKQRRAGVFVGSQVLLRCLDCSQCDVAGIVEVCGMLSIRRNEKARSYFEPCWRAASQLPEIRTRLGTLRTAIRRERSACTRSPSSSWFARTRTAEKPCASSCS